MRRVATDDEGSTDLSVVVTVVDGAAAVRRCLEALATQANPPTMEIFVPWDSTVPEVGDLSQTYPHVQFPLMELQGSESKVRNAFAQHELFDRRRSVGLCAAQGRFISMLEDRGLPHQNWARAMVDSLENSDAGAVGGVIENGSQGSLRWAAFFCDFGRYQPPIESARPEYLSDINICYRREVLESVSGLWRERYQEALVNWALSRKGFDLILSDQPMVTQVREKSSLVTMLKERLHWGRVFAHARRQNASTIRNAIWAAGTPILPPLLFVRHFRRQLRKDRNLREFLIATPAMWLFLLSWSIGELLGYCESTSPRS